MNSRFHEISFQVDHLSSVPCEQEPVAPEALLADFIRKSSAGINVVKTIICEIVVRNGHILVLEKPNDEEMERWPFASIKSCRPLPIQPAVFPNRYSNVLSITTSTDVHLFNVLGTEAGDAAQAINDEILRGVSARLQHSTNDLNSVNSALESETLNRCFDDIERVINRMHQHTVEYQAFLARWNELSSVNAGKKNKSSKIKEAEKARAAEMAVIMANQVRPEELMDTLQKLKLAFIIVYRLRNFLQPPSATAPYYVNLLMTPLIAIAEATKKPPLSAAEFDFVKSVDAPLFYREVLDFIFGTLSSTQLSFWRQLGRYWNLPLEELHEVRPYQPVFGSDKYSPILPFLDPAVIAVSIADVKDDLSSNVVYGIPEPEKPNVVAEVEPGFSYSISSDFRPPLEIQELDDVIAAADVAESVVGRVRPLSDSEYVGSLFAKNGRPAKAIRNYQATRDAELSVELDEVVEIVSETDGNFLVRNIYGETGQVPREIFTEIPRPQSSSRLSEKSHSSSSSAHVEVKPQRLSEASSSVHGRTEPFKNAIHSNSHSSVSEASADQKPTTSVAPPTNAEVPSDLTSHSATSSISTKGVAATLTVEEKILTSLNIRSKEAEAKATKKSTDSDDEYIPISMVPKPMARLDAHNEPRHGAANKDYNLPPSWLKPRKQNKLAARVQSAGGRVVKALDDHTALRSEELSIYVGETLELLEKPVGSWWRVRNAAAREGYAPRSLLQEMIFVDPQSGAPLANASEQPDVEAETVPKNAPNLFSVKQPEPLLIPTKVVSRNYTQPRGSTSSDDSNAEYLDDYSSSRPPWVQSQPELVIVEQQSDRYRDYRRRGSHDDVDRRQVFGAPLLAPFSSRRDNNAQFEENRQKAASALSLVFASQFNRLSTGLTSTATTEEIIMSPDTDATCVSISKEVAVEISTNNTVDAEKVIETDDHATGVTVVTSQRRAAGIFVKHPQPAIRSLRYSDLQHIRENMGRVTDQLNELALKGQLKLPKDKKIAPSKESKLTSDSNEAMVRKYLMQCGFPPAVVEEFGKYSGKALLEKEQPSDFNLPSLAEHRVHTQRLFNLVKGIRAKEEFETKVTRRRANTAENSPAQ